MNRNYDIQEQNHHPTKPTTHNCCEDWQRPRRSTPHLPPASTSNKWEIERFMEQDPNMRSRTTMTTTTQRDPETGLGTATNRTSSIQCSSAAKDVVDGSRRRQQRQQRTTRWQEQRQEAIRVAAGQHWSWTWIGDGDYRGQGEWIAGNPMTTAGGDMEIHGWWCWGTGWH